MVAHTLPVIRGADAIALIDGGAVAELGTTRSCSRAAAGTRACGAPRGSGAENPVDQVKVIQVWFWISFWCAWEGARRGGVGKTGRRGWFRRPAPAGRLA